MLNTYLQRTQLLLRDPRMDRFNIYDLVDFVNEGRKRIAADAQAIRFLPPSSGSFATLTVGAGGSGYTSPPTVTISGPDAIGSGFVQATATATLSGGVVSGFTLTNVGTGYINPTVTISGGGGSGARANFTLTPFLQTVTNQEVYTFANAASLIPAGQGIQAIIGVQSISVSWGAQKPTLAWIDWSAFQAYYRSINYGSSWPIVWSQYGQGVAGSAYLYPIPSQPMGMDWDCYCLPIPLIDDTTVEAIPYPWTDAVPFYAAFVASLTAGDQDRANYFEAKCKQYVRENRTFVSPSMVPTFYEGL